MRRGSRIAGRELPRRATQRADAAPAACTALRSPSASAPSTPHTPDPTDDPTAPALRPGGVFHRTGHGRQLRRSEEHTSELQSLMRISYSVFCLKKKKYTM